MLLLTLSMTLSTDSTAKILLDRIQPGHDFGIVHPISNLKDGLASK